MAPGKKIRPVVLVESIRGIIPERRLRRVMGRIAWVAVAPSASVASIRPAASWTSSPRRLSATADAVARRATWKRQGSTSRQRTVAAARHGSGGGGEYAGDSTRSATASRTPRVDGKEGSPVRVRQRGGAPRLAGVSRSTRSVRHRRPTARGSQRPRDRRRSPVARPPQRALSRTALQPGCLVSGAARITTSERFRSKRGQAWRLACAARPSARPRSMSCSRLKVPRRSSARRSRLHCDRAREYAERGSVLSPAAKACGHVRGERVRCFESREVDASLHLGPAPDVERAFGEGARRVEP
jgi:hypothetical protein